MELGKVGWYVYESISQGVKVMQEVFGYLISVWLFCYAIASEPNENIFTFLYTTKNKGM